jgi:hypothetical protein
MSAIERYQAELREAFVGLFGRPLITGIVFLFTLPFLGFPASKSAVIAAIVFVASAVFVGRRALHVAAIVLLLYAIPVYLEILPPPAQAISLLGWLAHENHLAP